MAVDSAQKNRRLAAFDVVLLQRFDPSLCFACRGGTSHGQIVVSRVSASIVEKQAQFVPREGLANDSALALCDGINVLVFVGLTHRLARIIEDIASKNLLLAN